MIPRLEALEASSPAVFLRGSFYVYPLVNALHILAIGALVTTALLMDLRILGIGKSLPMEATDPLSAARAILALIVAAITGVLLFSVRPLEYVDNPAFRLKLLLLVFAVANAVLFVILQTRNDLRSVALRILATVSLALWPAALIAGRFIGFFV